MNLAQQLELEEDRRATVYLDSLGFQTIGVGRLVDARRGGGLSEDEIDYLLANDIREKTAQVLAALPWAAGFSDPRRAVLIGMAFQLGINGLLAFRTALAAAQAGRWDAAEAAMLDSLWARQTPARAARLAKQLQTGVWQTAVVAAPAAPQIIKGPTYTGPNRRAP